MADLSARQVLLLLCATLFALISLLFGLIHLGVPVPHAAAAVFALVAAPVLLEAFLGVLLRTLSRRLRAEVGIRGGAFVLSSEPASAHARLQAERILGPWRLLARAARRPP